MNSDISFIDSRFLSELEDYQSSPVHVQARFIITELLDKQGLLINEDVLAARLGIDKTSSPDWELLKQSLRLLNILEYFMKDGQNGGCI